MKELAILQWYQRMGIKEIVDYFPNNQLKYNIYQKHKIDNCLINEINMRESLNSNSTNQPNSKTAGIKALIDNAKQLAINCKTIAELKKVLLDFEGCQLKKTANQLVFSAGNEQAKIMLIGEAPGANEDLAGIPFCGESGKLLDLMIKAIGLDRSNVYITNSIFWRPPGNRRPTPEEISICLPFVERHIALVKPKLIILVGSTAVNSVLNIKEAMSKIRGKFIKYLNDDYNLSIDTTAIYHPSYLLRQPSQKRLAWRDLLLIKKLINELNII